VNYGFSLDLVSVFLSFNDIFSTYFWSKIFREMNAIAFSYKQGFLNDY